MSRPRWIRAGLLLLIAVLLVTSGAAHASLHASLHAHGDHGHDHGGDHATVDGSHADCVACHLDLTDGTPPRVVPTCVSDAWVAFEAGPESPHASSLRGRAAPRAPPANA